MGWNSPPLPVKATPLSKLHSATMRYAKSACAADAELGAVGHPPPPFAPLNRT